MKAENLIQKGLALTGWTGEVVAKLGDVGARLFRLTADKEMIMFEEGHQINEWLVVLSGEVIVQTLETSLVLVAGDSLIIPPGVSHRLNVDRDAIGLIVRDLKRDPVSKMHGAVVDKAQDGLGESKLDIV